VDVLRVVCSSFWAAFAGVVVAVSAGIAGAASAAVLSWL